MHILGYTDKHRWENLIASSILSNKIKENKCSHSTKNLVKPIKSKKEIKLQSSNIKKCIKSSLSWQLCIYIYILLMENEIATPGIILLIVIWVQYVPSRWSFTANPSILTVNFIWGKLKYLFWVLLFWFSSMYNKLHIQSATFTLIFNNFECISIVKPFTMHWRYHTIMWFYEFGGFEGPEINKTKRCKEYIFTQIQTVDWLNSLSSFIKPVTTYSVGEGPCRIYHHNNELHFNNFQCISIVKLWTIHWHNHIIIWLCE